MQLGRYEIENTDIKIDDIAKKVLASEDIKKITRICERYSDEEDDYREYDVYKIKTTSKELILKKTLEREATNYEKYLSRHGFNVPEFYGRHIDGEDIWIVIENIEGDDLRNMTDALAIAAADSLSEIQNSHWNSSDTKRFDVYMEGIGRRNK